MAKATIGSISSGTLRTCDLLYNFAVELDFLRNSDAACERMYRVLDADSLEVPEEKEDAAQELLDEFAEELEALAPPYCTFGAHEGDGADFGFWPCMEAVAELPRVEDGDEAKALGEDCAAVNDHGNVTVYGGDGEVIWDCV